MQKGDFRTSITMPGDSERPEAQGERIIRLLERLVALSQDSLDKEMAEDFKRRNVTYPSGH